MPELPKLRQERFCQAVIEARGNVAAASRAVGYSPSHGLALSRRDDVRGRLAELRARELAGFMVGRSKIIARWQALAMADPRDLVQHKVGACRHCWGMDHAFQWRTLREFRLAWLDWRDRKVADPCQNRVVPSDPADCEAWDDPRIPSAQGGFGYSSTREPNRCCPDCDGLGLPYLWLADTSRLSVGAAALFAGARVTQHGTEIILIEPERALDGLARELGFA